MVDDKKIEEAKDNIFNKHFLKNNEGMICIDHISEPVYLDYQIKQAIELGAKWAINEFLKDLLHPSSEEPKNLEYIVFTTTMFGEVYLFTKQVNNTQDWKTIVECHGIEQWAYRDDIVSLIFKKVKK